MSITNLTGDGTQTETYIELVCSPTLVLGELQQYINFSLSNQHFPLRHCIPPGGTPIIFG